MHFVLKTLPFYNIYAVWLRLETVIFINSIIKIQLCSKDKYLKPYFDPNWVIILDVLY